MPALGDFFRIRAPADFVEAWDQWLQELMVTARQTLGPRYQDCYMSAPVWRFALPAGTAGVAAVHGVVMPSVDRVGREFPLTLISETPGHATPFRTVFTQTTTLDSLETLALDALGDDMTRDLLDARLADIAPAPAAPAGHIRRAPGGTLTLSGSAPAAALIDLAEDGLAPGRSVVWTCTVDDQTRLMTTTGLPRGPESLALIDLDSDYWAEIRS